MLFQAVPVSQSPPTLIIGIIVAVGAIVSPLISSWMTTTLTNRNAARMKLADYKRQDEIAQRLSDRQDLAERRAAEVASVLLVSNEKQEAAAAVQGAQIKQIHTLVNSEKTAGVERLLLSNRANLVLLTELIAERSAHGVPPSTEAAALVEAMKAKIAELEAELKDRAEETQLAADQLTADLKRKPA